MNTQINAKLTKKFIVLLVMMLAFFWSSVTYAQEAAAFFQRKTTPREPTAKEKGLSWKELRNLSKTMKKQIDELSQEAEVAKVRGDKAKLELLSNEIKKHKEEKRKIDKLADKITPDLKKNIALTQKAAEERKQDPKTLKELRQQTKAIKVSIETLMKEKAHLKKKGDTKKLKSLVAEIKKHKERIRYLDKKAIKMSKAMASQIGSNMMRMQKMAKDKGEPFLRYYAPKK